MSLVLDPRQRVSVKPTPPGSDKPAVSGRTFFLVSHKIVQMNLFV
jgi:hypothetical protein